MLFALVMVLVVALAGCRRAAFSVNGRMGLSGSLGSPGGGSTGAKATENFTSENAAGKVDILFIVDNSASMEIEQASMGARFNNLVTAIQDLDWQVGVTTTDCSTGTFGICGDLLPLTGASGRIMTPATPTASQVFRNTIIRPETVDCISRGLCPSGDEQALRAAISAIDKRTGINSGFFRANAATAIVILTDEDELSTGPASATNPLQVVSHFRTVFGARKTLRSYAITTLVGDSVCLQTQKDQQGGVGAFGTFSIALAALTGGASHSICAPNYASLLTQIGNDVQGSVTDAVTLQHTPVAGSVVVTFTPSQSILWVVHDNVVEFASPIPVGTNIEVKYSY